MVLQKQLEEQLPQWDVDALVRKQADARMRVRLLALAHLKDGKNYAEVARSLRVTRPCGAALGALVHRGWHRPSGGSASHLAFRNDYRKSRKSRCALRSGGPRQNGAVAGFAAKTSANYCMISFISTIASMASIT
jgi:hypothetical protein